jgi:hypothetical protein
VSQIFGAGLNVQGGNIEVQVTNGRGVLGFEVISLSDRHTVMGLSPWTNFSSRQSFSAQLAQVPITFYTSLNLLNTSASTRTVMLTAVGDNGTNLSAPLTIDLPPGKGVEQDVSTLFGLKPPFSGSLQVSANGDGIVGDVIFGEPSNVTYAAALSLQTQPFIEAVFSQIVSLDNFYTGLALFNDGSNTSDIQIMVFSRDGVKTGETDLKLQPGCRFARTIGELVPAAATQSGGYIRIISTLPLYGQELFGSSNFLSAVPPTIIR